MKRGTLYIVATPIGNLEDITLRALRILREVDGIAAEDTRRTRKLLNFYGITTPLESLYDEVEARKSPLIVSKLLEGRNIAYVSDAGTPGISDPGYLLIKNALENDIDVVAVPGPVAAVAAICVSGLPMDNFIFCGFPPSKKGKRNQFLESLKKEERTLIFYESPRRITAFLKECLDVFGDRPAALAREMTKIHEETLRGTISVLIGELRQRAEIKGEITLVIAGEKRIEPGIPPKGIESMVRRLGADPGLSTRDIVSAVSKELKVPRKDIYRKVLEILNKR
ncbi:MAG: 16S rRNA (cytidine(1402)-2'-O)-methyltransferase [Deltaproteobacteria bacterium]|nr:16S rRNA (cytidine(1402)-2'-O)-methyltransferase [Deltaproteobacteria bacterium]